MDDNAGLGLEVNVLNVVGAKILLEAVPLSNDG